VISLSATTKSIRVLPYTQTYQKVEDAIAFYKHELKARLELLGPSHIQVANIRDHLALLYTVKGKDNFKKAEKQFLKALDIKEKYYKNGDEEVATYLDQISQFYLQFGEYSKSESLLKRSLEIKRKALGSEHSSIAKTLDQLAQVYRKQGQYADAKPLFEQALQIYEKV
jgi:tetratricopeptide (TPR) repeat protein